jgi:hypothetical protein
MRSRIPFALQARMFFHGQERHADAVSAGFGRGEAQLPAFPYEKFVWNLDQDAGAVTGLRIAAAGSAVRQVQKNLDSLFNDVVALVAADAGDKPDPAGVVLVRG